MDQFSRTELVLGAAAVAHLKTCRVAIFGVGGVGGYAAEALVRSGVGAIDLYDDDRVCLTNLNRQLIATRKTVGQYKVDAMEQRLHDINPNVEIHTYKMFYMPDTADQVDLTQYDYVVDAVDTVTAKLELVCRAKRAGVRIISAMGAGNKLDPSRLRVAHIEKTSVCPLARVMRTELRKRKIRKLKVVFSDEQPVKPDDDPALSCRNHCICPPGTVRKCTARRDIPGSTAFVPPALGIMIASEIVRDLIAASSRQA